MPGTLAKLVLFTRDDRLASAVERIAASRWSVIRLPSSGVELQQNEFTALIIIDDELLDAGDCSRTLERYRKEAPHTAIIYVANHHDEETEKRARAGGILFYTAKPIDERRTQLVLDRLLKMHLPKIRIESRKRLIRNGLCRTGVQNGRPGRAPNESPCT